MKILLALPVIVQASKEEFSKKQCSQEREQNSDSTIESQ